jgi:aspartokinase
MFGHLTQRHTQYYKKHAHRGGGVRLRGNPRETQCNLGERPVCAGFFGRNENGQSTVEGEGPSCICLGIFIYLFHVVNVLCF